MDIKKNLHILEEKTIWDAVDRQIRIEDIDESNVNNHYSVTLSEYSMSEWMIIKKLKNYIQTTIIIDYVPIIVYTHFLFERNTLQYYYYFSENNKGEEGKIKFNIMVKEFMK